MALTAEQIGMIRQDYRLSKNKGEQIEILAQTNGITTAQVRKILWEGGLYPIGPTQIQKALELIGTERGGVKVGCGNIRNYVQAFQGLKAVDVRAVFRDWKKDPWVDEVAEGAPEPEPEQLVVSSKHEDLGFTGEERHTIFRALHSLYEEQRAFVQLREREVEKLKSELLLAEAALESAMVELEHVAKLEDRFSIPKEDMDGYGEE